MSLHKSLQAYFDGQVKLKDVAKLYSLSINEVQKLARQFERDNFIKKVEVVEFKDTYFDSRQAILKREDAIRNSEVKYLSNAELIKRVRAKILEEKQRKNCFNKYFIADEGVDEWAIKNFSL